MAIGGKFGSSSPTAPLAVGGPTSPADAATAVVVAVPPPVEYRWPRLVAELRDLSNVTGSSTPDPVAFIPAPPAGQSFVIERLAVSNPDGAAAVLLVGMGDLVAANVVDVSSNNPAPLAVSSDPNPIRLPANTQLWVIWVGRGTVTGCSGQAQLRVEQV